MNKKGFTLTEVLCVVTIIGILTGVMLKSFNNFKDKLPKPQEIDYSVFEEYGLSKEEMKLLTYNFGITLNDIPITNKRAYFNEQGIDTEKLNDKEIDKLWEIIVNE